MDSHSFNSWQGSAWTEPPTGEIKGLKSPSCCSFSLRKHRIPDANILEVNCAREQIIFLSLLILFLSSGGRKVPGWVLRQQTWDGCFSAGVKEQWLGNTPLRARGARHGQRESWDAERYKRALSWFFWSHVSRNGSSQLSLFEEGSKKGCYWEGNSSL